MVLGFAIAFTILLNIFLLQRRFGPLERLVDQMERADLSRPGANLRHVERPGGPGGGRPPAPGLHPDARAARGRAPARLERRARGPGGGARPGRPRPPRRGQPVADRLLLRLEAAREKAPPELAAELAEIRALANQAMQELLTLARQLRPTALDDLGLEAALAGHVRELDARGSSRRASRPTASSDDLPGDVQLVVYRVAQEALSNAVRHSGAEHVRVGAAPRRRHARAPRRRRRRGLHLRRGQRRARDRRDARAGAARRRRPRDRVAAGGRHKGSARSCR